MALQEHTKRYLKAAMCSEVMGEAVADDIDAGGDTLVQGEVDRLTVAVGSQTTGQSLETKINADTALTAQERHRLAIALGSWTAALDIDSEQG